ncbi:16S rRNA (cytosine(1402)-N(4))-methyltransferase RsmH [bacterium]|nr:16S rRNA (cytosine(1402)-N(4))-methyltransferase RsmH [bacterium]
MTKYHIPVLYHQCLDALDIKADGTYVDITFGGGGHSRGILDHLGPKGRLIAFDRDADAAENGIDDARFTLVHHDYQWITNFLEYNTAVPVHGILADLGVSSHQFDTAERGFSFRQDAPIDMRMDKDIELTAAHVLNQYPVGKLQTIFTRYGEIKNARSLAQAVENQRRLSPFTHIAQLIDLLEHVMHKKDKRNKYLSQVFQALRIEVNEELLSLERFLEQVPNLLAPGGRLVVITYHSLEDRLVKNFIGSGNLEGRQEKDLYGNVLKPLEAVTRKPIVPTEAEIAENPRARSAKLRVAERI